MSEETSQEAQTQIAAPTAQEETAATVQKQKGKKATTGNLIFDTAAELGEMSKTKVLNLADNLAENIETNYFKLGGALRQIKEQSWFDGYETFDAFVAARYGFQGRKAAYLIEIYTHLVKNQIDWTKVADLGWTKLKELAKILTPENTDEWVTKAAPLTVAELKALISGPAPDQTDKASTKTTSDTATLKFVFKADQIQTVTTALAKAKAELNTEYDTVALDNICTGYLGGSVELTKSVSFADQMLALGWEKALETFGEMFPHVDLEVTGVNAPADSAG